jgi:hypothetical protein
MHEVAAPCTDVQGRPWQDIVAGLAACVITADSSAAGCVRTAFRLQPAWAFVCVTCVSHLLQKVRVAALHPTTGPSPFVQATLLLHAHEVAVPHSYHA